MKTNNQRQSLYRRRKKLALEMYEQLMDLVEQESPYFVDLSKVKSLSIKQLRAAMRAQTIKERYPYDIKSILNKRRKS